MTKNLVGLGGVALALWVRAAAAFTYSDYDLLLVFRQEGLNDLGFNLGSVSNLLGRPNGTVLTVTNFDVNLVRSNFNNLVGVKFILLAATNSNAAIKRAYLTDGDPN